MSRNVKWNKNETSSKIEIIVEKHTYSINIIGRFYKYNWKYYHEYENILQNNGE